MRGQKSIVKSSKRIPKESSSAYPSVRALADDIGMCERSVRDALRRGEIPCIKIGKRYILPRAAIAEWLRNAGGRLNVIA
jgi:excisionase family DNA binding protein